MSQLEIDDIPVDQLPGDAVVTLYFSDQRPLQGPAALMDWRLNGQLTRMLQDQSLFGKAGEHLVLQNNGKFKAEWALFVGGGKWDGLCRDTYGSLIDHILSIASRAGFADISLCLIPHEEADADELVTLVEDTLKRHTTAAGHCRLSRVPLLGDN